MWCGTHGKQSLSESYQSGYVMILSKKLDKIFLYHKSIIVDLKKHDPVQAFKAQCWKSDKKCNVELSKGCKQKLHDLENVYDLPPSHFKIHFADPDNLKWARLWHLDLNGNFAKYFNIRKYGG